MTDAMVDKIVAAVLYEGYLLYPYRPSVKNRQRWTFGGLLPEAWCAARQSGDASTMQIQCLIRRRSGSAAPATYVEVAVRFLHLVNRTQGAERQNAWQEAIEREVTLEAMVVEELAATPVIRPFSFPHTLQSDGSVTREQHAIGGLIAVSATATHVPGCYRLTVRIANETPLDHPCDCTRDEALLRSFASTHIVLATREGGEFVSMTDPPAECRAAVDTCKNVGAWPILVGNLGEAGTMLCSPIILSDYPQLAPESPGDLFDGTEIDEILTLRIMALTDDEKREMASTDARAKALLERTESLTREQLMSLHGTLRELPPLGTGGPL